MVSHGMPSRSMVAIGDPSSTAEALPTPWKRSDQAISACPPGSCPSNPAIPLRVVTLAQAGEILFDFLRAAMAAQLEQRTLEPRQVAFAPTGGGDAQRAPVEVDHPALAVGIEQQVVGIEVHVVEAGAMEARDQAPGLVPRRAVAVDRGQVGQRTHVEQALHQDRGTVEGTL